MTLHRLVEVVRRRWYISLVGLLLAAATGVYVYLSTPSTYESYGVVTVVPATFIPAGNQPDGTAGTNPLIRFDDGLTRLTYVIVSAIDSPSVHADVAARTGGTFLVSNVEVQLQAMLPVIKISASGSDPLSAKATADAVVGEIDRSLLGLQNRVSVPADLRIHLDVTVQPQAGTSVGSSRAKAGAAGAVAVLIPAFAFLLVLDLFLCRRRRFEDENDGTVVANATASPIAQGPYTPRDEAIGDLNGSRVMADEINDRGGRDPGAPATGAPSRTPMPAQRRPSPYPRTRVPGGSM